MTYSNTSIKQAPKAVIDMATLTIINHDSCEFLPHFITPEVKDHIDRSGFNADEFIYKPKERLTETQANNFLTLYSYRCGRNPNTPFVKLTPTEEYNESAEELGGVALGCTLVAPGIGWALGGLLIAGIAWYGSKTTVWKEAVQEWTNNTGRPPNLPLDLENSTEPSPTPRHIPDEVPLKHPKPFPIDDNPEEDKCHNPDGTDVSRRTGSLDILEENMQSVIPNQGSANLILATPVIVYLNGKAIQIVEEDSFSSIRGRIIKDGLSSFSDFGEITRNDKNSNVLVARYCGKIVGITTFTWDYISRTDRRKIMNIGRWERLSKEYDIPGTGIAMIAVLAMGANLTNRFSKHEARDPALTALTTGAAKHIRNFFGTEGNKDDLKYDASDAVRANTISAAEFRQLINNIHGLSL